MPLHLSDLDHIATLSHLYLSEDERPAYLSQLQSVLGHMDALNALVVPEFNEDIEKDTPFREDAIIKQPELMIEKNAPSWEDHCFRVPKMLEDA